MKFWLVQLFVVLFCLKAQARGDEHYFVSVLKGTESNITGRLHIFVAGSGEEMETLFQESAASQAKRIAEIDPSAKIVLIANNEAEPGSKFDNKAQLETWGFKILRTETVRFLDAGSLINELLGFGKISSLQVYSHAATNIGILYSSDSRNKLLIGHFDSNAYAIFYGCNAGYDLAPKLSALWKIPVAGALSSADFQHLHDLGDFYRYEESLKPTGSWSKQNAKSFLKTKPCYQGACLRMKSDEFPYSGMHGDYKAGLPFYKFFCSGASEEQCLTAHARWLNHSLAIRNLKANTWKDYLFVVKDILCPLNVKINLRGECFQALSKIDQGQETSYSPFLGPMIKCDWKSCEFNRVSSTTFTDEYKFYRKAFAFLDK